MSELSVGDRIRRRLRAQVGRPFEERVRAPLRSLRNRGRLYRPLFVAGASGSGTSLLAVSLAQRFECAGMIYETNSQVAERSVVFVPPLDSFGSPAEYQAFMTPTEAWSLERVREDLLACYRRYCTGRGDVVVDKGPDIHLVRAEFLARCFPDGLFLLIHRDPAATIEGLRRKWRTFGGRPLSESIRFWAETHESFLKAAAGFPERVAAVEYEKLVADPDATLAALASRFGLAETRRRLRLDERPNVEGKGLRNVRQSRIGVVNDANRRALERMDPAEREEVQRTLGALHERLCALPYAL